MIAVSIVSHGHGDMVSRLLSSLFRCPEVGQIIVTRNIPEPELYQDDSRLLVISNDTPKGFAANHNAAFRFCTEPYFCVLNPDIELLANPFSALLGVFEAEDADLVAPLVLSSDGRIEDSFRHFPSLSLIFLKAFVGYEGRYSIESKKECFSPDWVAGMFMMFRTKSFGCLGGFDEGFFLYYEDVDICARAWQQHMRLLVCPWVSVIHDARRDSHRNLQYLRWHMASMVRYFLKHWGRLPKARDWRQL